MLLLQSGIRLEEGEIVSSPLGWHIFFAIIALVIWPIRNKFGKSARAIAKEPKAAARKKVDLLTVVTIAATVACTIAAYSTRDIAGYSEREYWAWLDSLYYYKPVYTGEWEALLSMYLLPLAGAGIMAAQIKKAAERDTFLTVFMARYPVIILLCYAGMLLSYILIQPPEKKEFSPETELILK